MTSRLLALAVVLVSSLLLVAQAANAADVPAADAAVAKVAAGNVTAGNDTAGNDTAGQDTGGRVYWKKGLNFVSSDKKFKVGFHGRLMLDSTFFGDADAPLEQAIGTAFRSGWQFRRAWLTVNGTAHKYVSWMVQLSMGRCNQASPAPDNDVGFLDVWVAATNLEDCFGCLFPDVKVGHYQEPFGLAWLTSSKYFQLTAWPTQTTTFTPGYNTGVTFHQAFLGERATARVGFFGNAGGLCGDGVWQDGYGVTGRFTCLPWAPCDCEGRLLHLGVSASYRGDVGAARFRSRADIDFGPPVIDTGAFAADSAWLVDFEAAWVYDAFNVQAECTVTSVDAVAGTDPLFWGAYVQAGWIFGASGRAYLRNTGTFGPPKVCSNWLADGCCGGGAWELAARVSYVDVDDGDKLGGTVGDVALGVNWYVNPIARVMLNFVYADVTDAYGIPTGDGEVPALVVRFQVYW